MPMSKSFCVFAASIVCGVSASAAIAYEAPPTVPVTDLLPPEIVNNADYTIDSDVPTDGFMGIFRLHTRFGIYRCLGREMLYTRLAELRALEKLDEVSKTKVFAKAAAGAAEEPVKAAYKIVSNPIGSAEAVPVGVAHLFKDVLKGMVGAGGSVVKVAKPREPGPKPPPSRDDPFGYNKLRSLWARKLGVDPYTTNRPLAVKLNHLATIGFATDKAVGVGMSFGLGPLGPIGEYVSWLPDVDEHLLTAPPKDVTIINERRLGRLGVPKESMKPLTENPWFTPTLQTRYVNALIRLKGVGGAAGETELAGDAHSEEEARFLCGCLEMLGSYNANVAPLKELSTHASVPAAVAVDGSLVVASPLDVLSWSRTTDNFVSQRDKSQPAVFCTNGILTKRAAAAFAAAGWKVRRLSVAIH